MDNPKFTIDSSNSLLDNFGVDFWISFLLFSLIRLRFFFFFECIFFNNC